MVPPLLAGLPVLVARLVDGGRDGRVDGGAELHKPFVDGHGC